MKYNMQNADGRKEDIEPASYKRQDVFTSLAEGKTFEALFTGFPMPAFALRNVGGEFILVGYNDAAREETGGKIEDFAGRSLTELCGENVEIVSDVYQCFGEKRTIQKETECTFKTDKISRIMNVTYTFISPDSVLVYTEDVSEVVANRNELKEREVLLQSLVDGISEAMVVVDKNGRIRIVNYTAGRMFCYNSEEIVGRTIEELVPDSFKSAHERHRAAFMGNPSSRSMGRGYDLMARRKDGSVFPVEVGLNTVMIGDEVLVIALVTDIMPRKKLEEKLRISEERWQFALEGSAQGVWDWNLETNKVYYSRQWKAMLGYKEEEISDSLEEWEKRVHPEDKEQCFEDIEQHKRGETSVYQNEHRMLCKDGIYKWVLDRGKVMLRDADGNPLRMVGTHADIHDRKHAEELLEKAARTDLLTGLSNRRDFIERLEVEASRFARTGRLFSIVMGDIDFFKKINDTYGHNCGDYVLKNIADLMTRSLRKQDAIGRWGGEEFILLLPETGLENAAQSAEKIREKIVAAQYSYHGSDFHVSMSFGVSVIDSEMTIDEAIKRADDRLYVAKKSGRNRVVAE